MNNENFQICLLKDVLLPVDGYIRGPFGSALKKEDMETEGFPVYEQQHAIYNHRKFRYFVNEIKYESMKRFSVQANDIIISCSGTIGCVSIIKKSDPIGIINQALLILRSDTSKIIPEFLKYYLLAYEGHQSLIECSKGSVQVNIAKRSVIENMKIKLPSIERQRVIVDVLSSLDSKKEKNIEEIKTYQEILNTIYMKWFSCVNENQDGWELSNVFDHVTESRVKNKDDHRYQVLSVIKEGEFRPSEEVFTKQVYSKSTTNYKIVKKNQVAYNPARANIGSIAMLKDYELGIVSPIYVVFEMKETITPTYFYYYMKQPMFLEGIKHHAIGTTRQNFPFEAFKMFPMVVPPMALQLEFEKTAKPIEEKIAKLKEENEVLAEIRDTLLPKLMNGEISLEEGEQ